jgi:hypothetical protein
MTNCTETFATKSTASSMKVWNDDKMDLMHLGQDKDLCGYADEYNSRKLKPEFRHQHLATKSGI